MQSAFGVDHGESVSKSKNATIQMQRIAGRATDNTVAQEFSRNVLRRGTSKKKATQDIVDSPHMYDDGTIWLGSRPGKYAPTARAKELRGERMRRISSLKNSHTADDYW